MNILTIFAGIGVLGLSSYMGYLSFQLFSIGGTTPIFGGIALAVLAVMSFVLGIVIIGLGWAGIVAHIRKGK